MTIRAIVAAILGPPGIWRFVRIVVITFAAAALGRLLPLPSLASLRRNRRRRRSRLALPSVLALLTAMVAASCAYGLSSRRPPASKPRAAPSHAPATAPDAGTLTGVFEPGATASYQPVASFTKASGVRPQIVLYYSGWNDPFQIRFAGWAHAHGAVPFAQMLPYGAPLAAVAAGRYDGYLSSFARAVRVYGHQVILGFAAEMNGSWYGWGNGHTAPRVFIAAWRHVVNLFRADGAANVVWIWTIDSLNTSTASIRRWWPGASYVNWVGLDGYYYRPSDTFASVFGSTVSAVRKFSRAPILISETAIGPGAGPSKIPGLFSGVSRDHLRGLVWFDQAQHKGLYHQDWRLEGRPLALRAFKNAVTGGR